MGKCEVCGVEAVGQVCCSTLGACSFFYCLGCLFTSAEPLGMVVHTVAMYGRENLDPSMENVIESTLIRTGKTQEEFDLAVMNAIRYYESDKFVNDLASVTEDEIQDVLDVIEAQLPNVVDLNETEWHPGWRTAFEE